MAAVPGVPARVAGPARDGPGRLRAVRDDRAGAAVREAVMTVRDGGGDPCGDSPYPTAEQTFADDAKAARDQWLWTTTGGLKGAPATGRGQ